MSLRLVSAIVVAAFVLPTWACRKPAKVILTKDQRSRIEENILKERPQPKVAVNANFGDNIMLLGVDLSSDRVKPGEQVTITWYWEALRETPGEWKVFGHLELPGGKRMLLDHTPVGELYPIFQWKKGEIIRDIQRFVVDADTKPGVAVLWAGIFNEEIYRERGGGDRMNVVNKDKVTHDGDNRVKVVQFTVVEGGEASQASRPLVLKAYKASGPVKVDGQAHEPDWAAVITSAPFQLASRGAADAQRSTTVKALYDDKALYFFFHVLDKAIEATLKDRDSELWKEDVVEIYLDPGADGKDYVELQVSPANVVFDAQFKSHRTPDWKEARAWNLQGLETAVVVSGTLNKPDDQDTSYDVEVAVPFAALTGLAKVPPEPGTTMRVNFFRMDAEGGKIVGAQAFSPAGNDFHDLTKAGTLEFAGQRPGAAEAPIAPAAGSQPLRVQVSPSVVKAATSLRQPPLEARPPRPPVK